MKQDLNLVNTSGKRSKIWCKGKHCEITTLAIECRLQKHSEGDPRDVRKGPTARADILLKPNKEGLVKEIDWMGKWRGSHKFLSHCPLEGYTNKVD